jgi:hypothetical protein
VQAGMESRCTHHLYTVAPLEPAALMVTIGGSSCGPGGGGGGGVGPHWFVIDTGASADCVWLVPADTVAVFCSCMAQRRCVGAWVGGWEEG